MPVLDKDYDLLQKETKFFHSTILSISIQWLYLEDQ